VNNCRYFLIQAVWSSLFEIHFEHVFCFKYISELFFPALGKWFVQTLWIHCNSFYNIRVELIFDEHCQTYGNLLPNCYQKCQIIVPIDTDPNKLRTHFCAHFGPWIL